MSPSTLLLSALVGFLAGVLYAYLDERLWRRDLDSGRIRPGTHHSRVPTPLQRLYRSWRLRHLSAHLHGDGGQS